MMKHLIRLSKSSSKTNACLAVIHIKEGMMQDDGKTCLLPEHINLIFIHVGFRPTKHNQIILAADLLLALVLPLKVVQINLCSQRLKQQI